MRNLAPKKTKTWLGKVFLASFGQHQEQLVGQFLGWNTSHLAPYGLGLDHPYHPLKLGLVQHQKISAQKQPLGSVQVVQIAGLKRHSQHGHGQRLGQQHAQQRGGHLHRAQHVGVRGQHLFSQLQQRGHHHGEQRASWRHAHQQLLRAKHKKRGKYGQHFFEVREQQRPKPPQQRPRRWCAQGQHTQQQHLFRQHQHMHQQTARQLFRHEHGQLLDECGQWHWAHVQRRAHQQQRVRLGQRKQHGRARQPHPTHQSQLRAHQRDPTHQRTRPSLSSD